MIFLLILKWIGIILLSILLILLAFLLYLILFPIHIKAEGEGDSRSKDLNFTLSIRGFLYFFGVDISRRVGEEQRFRASLCWGLITLCRRPGKKEEKAVRLQDARAGEKDRDDGSEDVLDLSDPGLVIRPSAQLRRKTSVRRIDRPEPASKDPPSEVPAGIVQEGQKTGTRSEVSSTKRPLIRKGPSSKKRSEAPKEPPLKEKGRPSGSVGQILGLLRAEESKESLRFLLRRLTGLIRSFHLRLKETDLAFDLDDPQNTAYLAGLISILPLIYRRSVSIRPDFVRQEMYVSGRICLKMRPALRSFLWAAVRILLNRNCRKTYHRVKEILAE